MKFKFCPLCGRSLIEKYSWDEGGVPYCEYDDIMYFDTPKPCVVVAVVKGDEILLLKQSYIFKNSKVLVSGYVTVGETLEETVYREVKEETGITIDNIKYLGSQCIKSKELLMITFMATYLEGEIEKSAEVEWVQWESLENALCEMTEDEIGKNIVKKVLEEVQYKGHKAYSCDISSLV
ncbi:NADH pyrophosphatase [bioreactor metagenome]|uniref:NAD(+) diphosphatase n=1 Tax=bioreactor metagenome TaxID=1076179 RepID=A0A644Z418_9ZZZZ